MKLKVFRLLNSNPNLHKMRGFSDIYMFKCSAKIILTFEVTFGGTGEDISGLLSMSMYK